MSSHLTGIDMTIGEKQKQGEFHISHGFENREDKSVDLPTTVYHPITF